MQLDKDLISRLEKLARLQLSDTDRAAFADDLTRILDMVDHLREVNTEGVEPLTYLTDEGSNLREDLPGQQWTQEEALRNAPKQDGRFFRVPKVIE